MPDDDVGLAIWNLSIHTIVLHEWWSAISNFGQAASRRVLGLVDSSLNFGGELVSHKQYTEQRSGIAHKTLHAKKKKSK